MIKSYLTERTLFYSVFIVNVLLILYIKFYPTLDGVCHLYNSNLINHLLNGDSPVIESFFILNNKIIPNWTCYFILSSANSFLPAWMAEKIFILIYLGGIVFSFRFLIKQLRPDNPGLSILVFPFAYPFLLHLGFYNYCFSFVLLFLTLGYWHRNRYSQRPLKYIVLCILLTLTYFSAILTFAFTGLCLALMASAHSLKKHKEESASPFTNIFRELFLLILAALPGIVFSLLFIKSTFFFPDAQKYSMTELIKWLNDVRCLIVFDYNGEEKLTEQFLHLMIGIIAVSLYLRFSRSEKNPAPGMTRVAGDIFLVPVLISLFLYFTVPDTSSAGMMSDRFCLLAYMFFIIWVASQALPSRITLLFSILIAVIHLGLHLKQYNATIKGLNRDAVTIYEASKSIEENSVLLPVNMTGNWLEPHFSNYLGIDKPMIILENYEATVGWYPLEWNYEKMPLVQLGDLDSASGITWPLNPNSKQIKQIDYVFLYGNTEAITEPRWAELKQVLDKEYKVVYSSENKSAIVYRRFQIM